MFASLGIKAIRYPVLWERHASNGIASAEWSWADARLNRLREIGIRPIAGLLHHGSGPTYTSLIDPDFPEKLAEYAAAVARRYPWIDAYTPVNEPLTTARFSGLYGHWYPHGRDEATFMRALINQCRGTVLAMAAIREVNPAAQLIQTEDLGKAYSTRHMAYQAAYENERRWLSLDLLTGRVDDNHRFWSHLIDNGIPADELEWLRHNSVRPDVIGINHYLTSERFLDHRVDLYPEICFRGHNGRDQYVDVEAVRVRKPLAGHERLLREAWRRYRRPLAITEVHLCCTREEQLRWMQDAWNASVKLSSEGVPVQGVTSWSLLGAFDWNSLLTRADDFYEPGAFDVRGGKPRATAVAKLCQHLASGTPFDHPVMATPGWWRRNTRVLFPKPMRLRRRKDVGMSQPLVIVGAGTLGQAYARIAQQRGLEAVLLARNDLDIADPVAVGRVAELRPWAIINAAGYVRVDEAEQDIERCRRENVIGAGNLAEQAHRLGVPLLTFSSDLVFDGRKNVPYVEADPVAPLNVYGMTKVEAEDRVLGLHDRALVIRTSAFFGPWDQYNFITVALRSIERGETFMAASDAIVSPTYVPDLVHASLDLIIDGERGIWHLANRGEVSWEDLAKEVARRVSLDSSYIEGRPIGELTAAPRPRYSVLGSERGDIMPALDDALMRYLGTRSCTDAIARR